MSQRDDAALKPKPVRKSRRKQWPVQRPSWTYPGKELLRLAREARAEIEASGWFGRRGHVE